MLNETTFREMLLPSSGKVNDYATHIYSKYDGLEGLHRSFL